MIGYEFKKSEPVFEHPEFGRTKQDFEKMTDHCFLEIDAFGRPYNREQAVTRVTKLYEDPNYCGIYSWPEDSWSMSRFAWFNISHSWHNIYRVTYLLRRGEQLTYRSSLWSYHAQNWKISFHQATLVVDTETSLTAKDGSSWPFTFKPQIA